MVQGERMVGMLNLSFSKRTWHKACVSGLYGQFQTRNHRTPIETNFLLSHQNSSGKPGCWGKLCVIIKRNKWFGSVLKLSSWERKWTFTEP